jgi:hypothetical protein
MAKALAAAREGELAHVPPVLHQLAKLALQGGRGQLLAGVLALLEGLSGAHRCAATGRPAPALAPVVATCLAYLSEDVSYDAALAAEWVKGLRALPHRALTPSAVQLALSLARNPRLAEPLLAALKRLSVASLVEAAGAGRQPAWLAQAAASSSSAAATGPLLPPVDAEATFLRALRDSASFGDAILQPLLALAFELMAARILRPLALAAAARAGPGAGPAPASAGTGVRSALMGMRLLEAVFEQHPEARPQVLRGCVDRITTGGMQASLAHVLLLGRLAARQPALMGAWPRHRMAPSAGGGGERPAHGRAAAASRRRASQHALALAPPLPPNPRSGALQRAGGLPGRASRPVAAGGAGAAGRAVAAVPRAPRDQEPHRYGPQEDDVPARHDLAVRRCFLICVWVGEACGGGPGKSAGAPQSAAPPTAAAAQRNQYTPLAGS